MGLSVLNQPVAAGGGIKSVQRGSAGGAGNVTITAVDITKAFVTVFGTTSSGTVAASGTINATSGNINAANGSNSGQSIQRLNSTGGFYDARPDAGSSFNGTVISGVNTGTISMNSQSYTANSTSLTGGSNNLVAAVVQGYLSNSTTLVVSGACRYEVVEFN